MKKIDVLMISETERQVPAADDFIHLRICL